MNSQRYSVVNIKQETAGTFILQVEPFTEKVFPFKAGQFAKIENPLFTEEGKKAHFFSIASSPKQKDYLEFCFKVYGNWTKRLSQKKLGEELLITGPYGKFIWDSTKQNVIFLAGGVGIVPFISMLRFIREEKQAPRIILLYGSRTESQISYKDEVENIISTLPKSRVLYILSDIYEGDSWKGYRGFLTKEILEREVDFSNNPTFFLCGPPIFVQLAEKLLKKLNIEDSKINRELFSV